MKTCSPLYEIPVFYLLLAAINFLFFPDLPGFIDVDPNPCWLGILLFGFHYGILGGLSSGVLSALLYLGASWFYVERYLLEDLSFYFLPSSFILLGVFTGVVTQRSRSRISKLGEEKESILKTVVSLKEENHLLEEINRQFEKKIVTRMSTLVTLYEGARRLETLKTDDLYHAILEFTAKTLDAEEVSLYLKTIEGWKLHKSIGWKEYSRRPTLINWNEGIIGLAGSQNKIVTVRDFIGGTHHQEGPRLLGDAIAAGPLKRGEQGETIGLLCIQKMPFPSFNSSTMNLFSFLLCWASRSVGRAHFIQELQESEILDPELHIYSDRYFRSRLKQEFARSKTYSLPLCVGLVEVKDPPQMAAQRQALWMTLAESLKQSSREMDVIAHFKDPKTPFGCLLVTTGPKQAEKIRQKISQNLALLNLPFPVRLGFGNFIPKMNQPDELLEKAREALNHA